jgi:hypothetical protein
MGWGRALGVFRAMARKVFSVGRVKDSSLH